MVEQVPVREIGTDDRPRLRRVIAEHWGLPLVSVSGAYADPSELPGFVAEAGGDLLGALTYVIGRDGIEVLTLNNWSERRGVGTALLARVHQLAQERGLRLWLITTDDNPEAIRFYERRGMRRVAVYPDFVRRVRDHKPDVNGDFRDAFEYSY